MSNKKLLIVYHSMSGTTKEMANAVYQGATDSSVDNVDVTMQSTFDTNAEDLLNANALILGTPENFGYMSGAMKDFFDRTFYEVEGKLAPLPYAIFISAGNDGSGALTAIRRIAKGYPFIESQEPIVVKGKLNAEDRNRCVELGLTFSAGLEAGIF